MESILNLGLLKNPLNYLVVFFMVAVPLTLFTVFHERLGSG